MAPILLLPAVSREAVALVSQTSEAAHEAEQVLLALWREVVGSGIAELDRAEET